MRDKMGLLIKLITKGLKWSIPKGLSEWVNNKGADDVSPFVVYRIACAPLLLPHIQCTHDTWTPLLLTSATVLLTRWTPLLLTRCNVMMTLGPFVVDQCSTRKAD